MHANSRGRVLRIHRPGTYFLNSKTLILLYVSSKQVKVNPDSLGTRQTHLSKRLRVRGMVPGGRATRLRSVFVCQEWRFLRGHVEGGRASWTGVLCF